MNGRNIPIDRYLLTVAIKEVNEPKYVKGENRDGGETLSVMRASTTSASVSCSIWPRSIANMLAGEIAIRAINACDAARVIVDFFHVKARVRLTSVIVRKKMMASAIPITPVLLVPKFAALSN